MSLKRVVKTKGNIMLGKNKIMTSLYNEDGYKYIQDGGNDESLFVFVDRKVEDEGVINFQKTGDLSILEKLYHNRIQTLQIWANRYYYLRDSREDMFAELTHVFIKAVHGYKDRRKCKIRRKGKSKEEYVWRKTPFNTYLYYSLDHFVQNLRSNKGAKKRRPLGSDPNSISNFTLSLDYNYSPSENTETTLKDIIADDLCNEEDMLRHMYLEEVLDVLSNENQDLRAFLKKISDGNSVAALLKEYRIKEGKIKVSSVIAKRLNDRKCNRVVGDLIKNKANIQEGFKVLNYNITKIRGINKLCYVIEMKKTKEVDNILREVRKLKKNRDTLLAKINS